MCKIQICRSKIDEDLEIEAQSLDTIFRVLIKQQFESEKRAYRELVEKLGYEPKPSEIIIERYPVRYKEGDDGSIKFYQDFKFRVRGNKERCS